MILALVLNLLLWLLIWAFCSAILYVATRLARVSPAHVTWAVLGPFGVAIGLIGIAFITRQRWKAETQQAQRSLSGPNGVEP